MKILGLQKLTLLDYPSKVACTVFLGGCNFRCPYCHNASVVLMTEKDEISQQELFEFLKKRTGRLDGVCITGGEPLINDDIIPFIEKIRNMGYLIKLDTNGAFPQKLNEIINKGIVDYIAMDIKNSLSRYSETVGKNINTYYIEESIKAIMSSNIPYEFRTTVVKGFHDEQSFSEIGEMISGAKNYYLQSFVNSGNLICSDTEGFSKDKMLGFKNIASKYVKNAEIRGV